MKKVLLILPILALVLISGCTTDKEGVQQRMSNILEDAIDVVEFCDDGVICYLYRQAYGGGLDCFRDADLVEKYCGDDGILYHVFRIHLNATKIIDYNWSMPSVIYLKDWKLIPL